MIGGALSRPAERFPEVFGNSTFLKTYPYFLPCAIPATFSLVAWIVTYLYLKEVYLNGFISYFKFTDLSISRRIPLATLSGIFLRLSSDLKEK